MKKHWFSNGQVVRTNLVFSAFLLWAAIQAVHLFFLQDANAQGDYYRDCVRKRWNSFDYPEGRRGNIYFRDGSLLAGNQKVARIIAEPSMFSKYEKVAGILGPLMGIEPQTIFEKLNSYSENGLVLDENVPVSVALAIGRESLRGIFIRYYYQRTYPHKDYGAAATVGYARKQPKLSIGLEATQNARLTGTKGEVHFRRDADRNKLPGSLVEVVSAVDGDGLSTTLHPSIQLVCEDEIRTAIAKNQAKMGCILVMEPGSGEVLGVATYPTFDPNEYVKGNIGDEYNVIIHRVVEPGSTAKPILAAYALDKAWLNPNLKYDVRRKLIIDGYTITEAEAGHTVGDASGANLRDIIVGSSNKGMAQVAIALGADRVYASYKQMGLFEPTGIELPVECAGLKPYHYANSTINGKQIWPKITLANVGFGQGMALTPIQLATAYCVIANGGMKVRPTLLLDSAGASKPDPNAATGVDAMDALIAVAAGEGGSLEDWGDKVVGGDNANGQERLISKQTANTVTGWLTEVVTSGTGKNAALSRYQAAGKTGTAQVYSPKGGYKKGAYVSSFVGFFPVEEPRYVVLVMFWEPQGKYYGSQVAAPVFQAVGDRISYIDELVSLGGKGAA